MYGPTWPAASDLRFPRFEEILEINRRMVATYGGFYVDGDSNLANPGSLRHTLALVRSEGFFGHDPYPTVTDKAALLAWRIIRRHVFHDGCMRTGMEACRLMLELNGYDMRIDHEVADVAEQIGKRELSFDQFVSWLRARVSETS
jgi:death-on-curing family protein